jgi:hypothetical protein
MSDLSLTDLIDLPDAEASEPAVKVMEARGRSLSFTARTDANTDPVRYYTLAAILGSAADKKGIKVSLLGTPFSVAGGAYLNSLKILSSTVTAPSWGLDEWAVFGRKFGGAVVAQLAAWALTVNGLNDVAPSEVEEAVGEATGAEVCETEPSAPVSIS